MTPIEPSSSSMQIRTGLQYGQPDTTSVRDHKNAGAAGFSMTREGQAPRDIAPTRFEDGRVEAHYMNRPSAPANQQSNTPDRAWARIEAAGEIADPLERMDALRHGIGELTSQLQSPEAQTMTRLMALQSSMSQAALSVEMLSKFVEHGVSGAKTVLQTQT